jgi:hypothetical protein
MEALMPELVAEKLPVTVFAERAGVGPDTAARFLREKCDQYSRANEKKFFNLF